MVVLGDSLGLEDRVSGGAVRAEVAEVKHALHTRPGGHFRDHPAALHIHAGKVGAAAAALGADQVVDHVDILHGRAQPALVFQAADRHFHRHAAR